MNYISDWIDYLIGKVKGDQPIYWIAPRLFQSPEIRKIQEVKDLGIELVIDLDGSFDDKGIADFADYHFIRGIKDDPSNLPDKERMIVLHEEAVFAMNYIAEAKRVLVHCTMGKNRSSLLVGIILRLLYPNMTGQEIVEHIRLRNPGALSNETFANYLEGI